MLISPGLTAASATLREKGRKSVGVVVASEVRHAAQTERKARRAEGLAMLEISGQWGANRTAARNDPMVMQ
jgi:hypothetical protein